MKICTKCKVDQPLSNFTKSKSAPDGLRYWCKTCEKSYDKSRPKEKIKEKCLIYYQKNKEKIKKRYKESKEKIKSYAVSRYKKNPEACKLASLEWKQANPEAVKIFNQNRRARKNANGEKLSKGLIEKLSKLQRRKCACCGLPLGEDFHMDHIMPLALGGANTDDNIQLLRQQCNNQKHAKHPIDFMQSRGYLL